jgi:hypothetical protein
MTSTKRQRRPISVDIEFIASLEADELRFDDPPETAVRLDGEPDHESTYRSDRTNLPEKLNPACRIRTSGRLHGSPAASLGRPSRLRHEKVTAARVSATAGARPVEAGCRGALRPVTALRSRCLAELFSRARSQATASGNSPPRSESPPATCRADPRKRPRRAEAAGIATLQAAHLRGGGYGNGDPTRRLSSAPRHGLRSDQISRRRFHRHRLRGRSGHLPPR